MAETFRLRGEDGVVHTRRWNGWETLCRIEVIQYGGLSGPVREQTSCINCLAANGEPYLLPEAHVWVKDDD